MPKQTDGNRELIRNLEDIAVELNDLKDSPVRVDAFRTSNQFYAELSQLYNKYNPITQQLTKEANNHYDTEQ